MRAGMFSCGPETDLRTVARVMATNRVHSVVVVDRPQGYAGEGGSRLWGIVADSQLVRLAGEVDDRVAADAATSDVLTITPERPLAEAAGLMARSGQLHLVVVDPDSGHPIGMLSSLDVADALAWG